jgi:hypothetical protein
MVQCSFRPPNADYLGFKATREGIIETACKAEALGFDAVFVNRHFQYLLRCIVPRSVL